MLTTKNNPNNLIQFLKENNYFPEYSDLRRFSSLSEAKQEITHNNIVNKLYATIKLRYDELNVEEIHESKGDITKLKNYAYILEAHKYLRYVLDKSENKKDAEIALVHLNTLELFTSNLVKEKKNFEACYQANKDFNKMLYSMLVTSVIISTSTLIAISVDYIQKPDMSFEIAFAKKNKKSIKDFSAHMDHINRFNKLIISGDFDKLMQYSLREGLEPRKTGKASVYLKEELATILGALTIGGLALLSLLFIMRYMVFYYFNVRQRIADYLYLISEYVEYNVSIIEDDKSNNKNFKSIIKKQKGYIETLNKLAKKIEVYDKRTNKRVSGEIKDDDKQNYNVTTHGSGDIII